MISEEKTRESLHPIIGNAINDAYQANPDELAYISENTLLRVLEILEKQSPWISVADQLPCIGNDAYLVRIGGRRYKHLISEFNSSMQMFECEDDYPVTHWMPLPKEPK